MTRLVAGAVLLFWGAAYAFVTGEEPVRFGNTSGIAIAVGVLLLVSGFITDARSREKKREEA